MSDQLMTPAEIERAVKEACVKACEGMQYCDPQPHHYAAAIRALPPMFGDVPAGWKLVPLEPTGEMLGVLTNVAARCNSWREGYKALLAAAPTDDVRGTAGWPMEEQPDGSVNPIDPADMGLTPTAGQAAAKDAAAADKDADGWIKWEGGECPVPNDTLVEVKFQCGDSNSKCTAYDWDWSHGDATGYDIIAYRVISAAPEVK